MVDHDSKHHHWLVWCAAEEEDLAPKNEKKCQTLTVFLEYKKDL